MNFPIEMYKIRQEEMRIKLPCERCMDKGIVDKSCHKCGGKGTRYKTIKVWKVAPKTETVEKIDRGSKDHFYHSIQTCYEGGLRYWTEVDTFYNEADRYLHFTKLDAQKECDKRNESIADILKVIESNKHMPNNSDIESETTPVKNGEWLYNKGIIDMYDCSTCGFSVYADDYYKEFVRTNYCPQCGTKMKGELK